MGTEPWSAKFRESARKELRELPEQVRLEALGAIVALTEDPLPPDAVALRGHKNRYRIRFYRDRFRIVYDLSYQQRKIIVVRIRPRDPDTYRGLDRW